MKAKECAVNAARLGIASARVYAYTIAVAGSVRRCWMQEVRREGWLVVDG